MPGPTNGSASVWLARSVLDRLRRRMIGLPIRFHVRGAPLHLTLRTLMARSERAWSGRFAEVQIEADGISWGGRSLRAVALRCEDVTVTPGKEWVFEVASADLTATIGQDSLRSWLPPRLGRLSVHVEGEALRVSPAGGPRWLSAAFTVRMRSDARLGLRLTALGTGRGRLPLTAMPEIRVSVRPLPQGVRVVNLSLSQSQVLATCRVTDWRLSVPQGRIATVLGNGAQRRASQFMTPAISTSQNGQPGQGWAADKGEAGAQQQ